MIGTQFPTAGSTEKIKKRSRALTTAASKEEEDVHFGRLPDDIIIDIFGRFNDCKFLIQCLLVSKRIASLIRLVSSIKIHIPSFKTYSIRLVSWDYNNLTGSISQVIEFQSWWKYGIDNSFFIRKARKVLHYFNGVKTAIVEYPTKFDLFSLRDSNTVRWIEYSGGGDKTGIFKSCAFLGPIRTRLDSRQRMMSITWVISDLFASAFIFYPMVAQMVQDHESLRDILVTSTEPKRGWIYAGEDEIAKMRQVAGVSSTDNPMKKIWEEGMHITMKVKVWYNVTIPIPPRKSSRVYAFMVVSRPDNIDHEVKATTSRLWGDFNYDDERVNMRELVETRPCNLEFTWIANYRAMRKPHRV